MFLYELPQNLLGFIFTKIIPCRKVIAQNNGCSSFIYYITKINIGICLGEYIIVNENDNVDTILHEYGHSLQSRKLGWLYLFVIGIPSICLNIWDILFHGKWSNVRRSQWYYSRFPENWADRLGGVIRP